MRFVAGIDIGSGFTKAVILQEAPGDSPAIVLGRGRVKTGIDMEGAARDAFRQGLGEAGLEASRIEYVTTTGFGRYSIRSRDIQVTEITAAARAARHLFPLSHAVLDIGSQSTRAISLSDNGKVHSFKTNDKCAAGSGSFIVRATKYLQVDLDDVGDLALDAANPQAISSVCAVLAESEIINHVSAGASVSDILNGIYGSLAERASMLMKRAGMKTGEDLIFIGGVARQQGMVKALEARLNVKVHVPENCDFVCALGAALLGLRRLQTSRSARCVA